MDLGVGQSICMSQLCTAPGASSCCGALAHASPRDMFSTYCVRKKLQIHIAEMLQSDWALLEKCFRSTGHYWQCVSDTNCRNASERLGTTVHPTMHAGDPRLGCLLEEIRQLCSQMAEPPRLLQICCLYSCVSKSQRVQRRSYVDLLS